MKRAPHIKMTEREFRKLKRWEVAKVRLALSRLRAGCIYMPDGCAARIGHADALMDAVRDSCLEWWKKA